jgi:hypothetical protein
VKGHGAPFAEAACMDITDLSETRLHGENEIDNAIYAVLCAAFCEDDEEALRRAVRARLQKAPTPQEIVDAVCAELRCRGRLFYEEQRRLHASHVLAAFLDLPAAERADVSLMAVA